MCRLEDSAPGEEGVQAEAAILQLLEPADSAKQKRAADGSWRPPAGALDTPNQAMLRLYDLYSSDNPPPVSLIRQPQVNSCVHCMGDSMLTCACNPI